MAALVRQDPDADEEETLQIAICSPCQPSERRGFDLVDVEISNDCQSGSQGEVDDDVCC